MIIDNGVADEVLVLQAIGIQINIAALIDHINSNGDQYQIFECGTDKLLSINRTDGINTDVLAKMDEARLKQPVLVTAIDECEWVIDGNHRLLKRYELGNELTRYIPINGKQLEPFLSEFSWR